MHTRRWKQNVKEVGFVFLVLLLLLHKNGAKRGKSEMLRDSGGISIVRDDVSHACTYTLLPLVTRLSSAAHHMYLVIHCIYCMT